MWAPWQQSWEDPFQRFSRPGRTCPTAAASATGTSLRQLAARCVQSQSIATAKTILQCPMICSMSALHAPSAIGHMLPRVADYQLLGIECWQSLPRVDCAAQTLAFVP